MPPLLPRLLTPPPPSSPSPFPSSLRYDGPRPTSGNYQPSKKQGAIILATGGDNSNSAEGNFYEGYMTTGYTSEATDAAVQANIIAAGYRTY